MALEAEIVSVSRRGESVVVVAAFIDSGRELVRETISFPASQTIDESVIRRRLDEVGAKISTVSASEVFANSQIGRRFEVRPLSAPEIIAPAPRSS